jgi:hypothetical protein
LTELFGFAGIVPRNGRVQGPGEELFVFEGGVGGWIDDGVGVRRKGREEFDWWRWEDKV